MLNRDVSQDLKDHFAQDTTTIARCWRIYRKDGEVYAFTEADQELVVDDIVHKPLNAGQMSAFESTSDTSPDNMEAEVLLDSSNIDAVDLQTGLFDGAKLEYFIVNYENLSQGKFKLTKGWLGEVEMEDDEKASVEFTSLMGALQQTKGRQFTYQCDVKELGDNRCGVDVEALAYSGEVSSFTGRDTFRDYTISGETEDYFRFGVVEWKTGYNAGLSMEVKSFAGEIPISYVDTDNNVFGVPGNETTDESLSGEITVSGSSGNDGTYTVASSEYQYAIGTITANGISADIYNMDRYSVTVQGDPFNLQDEDEDNDEIEEGDRIEINGTPDSDGDYECSGASYSDGKTIINSYDRIPLSRDMETTFIYVEENIPDNTADGHIVGNSEGRFEIFLPMPFPIQKGDRFKVYPGCDRYFGTCKDRFDNVVNFRGFPHIPGRDAVMKYPDAKG